MSTRYRVKKFVNVTDPTTRMAEEFAALQAALDDYQTNAESITRQIDMISQGRSVGACLRPLPLHV